jgi:hypothetical protein
MVGRRGDGEWPFSGPGGRKRRRNVKFVGHNHTIFEIFKLQIIFYTEFVGL